MSRDVLPPIVWAAPERPRPSLGSSVVTVAAVLVLVLGQAAFLIDLHNVFTTPASCDVYCATVPAVEVPALLGLPVLALLGIVCATIRFAVRGPRQVLGWVLLAVPLVQVAVALEMGTVLRLFS